MSKVLTIKLDRSLLIESVKADTYITGEVEKASNANNHARAYAEQAGDDTYHERKLIRTLRGAVGSLEANLMEFVDSSDGTGISDTLKDTTASKTDFVITINVSDRYSDGMATPLASLSQEFIANKMLALWWQAINPQLAKDYTTFVAESLANIRLCLAKVAPKASAAKYEDVIGEITPAQ
jgi:hypothetical protein